MDNNSDLQKNILKKIESGDVLQKSRWYFVLKGCAYGLGVMLSLLIVTFFTSFVVFVTRGQGLLLLPDLGIRGVGSLLLSIPWILILIIIVFIIVLELLGRHFAFVYRKPLVYSILGIILVTVFAGGALAATPLHEKMYDRAMERGIPFGGSEFYKQYSKSEFRGGFAGVIRSITEEGLQIETLSGDVFFVSTSTKTRYPKNAELKEGSHVVVLGKKEKGGVEALGIRTIDRANLPHIMKRLKDQNPKQEERFPRTPRGF